MHDTPQINSAIDAVRCLYLAKVTEQKGHPDAAGRWQQMADGWLDRLESNSDRKRPSPTEATDSPLQWAPFRHE
jgi:hypothetical protein